MIFTELGMSSYDERKKVFDTMKLLVKPEQEEIFRIIRKMKENYTENSNGIFFDLSIISDDTFIQIKEYLRFCLRTREEHEDRLKELETIRIQNEIYTDLS
jgi:dsDNA-specific endonuclease/ATPase MutS2